MQHTYGAGVSMAYSERFAAQSSCLCSPNCGLKATERRRQYQSWADMLLTLSATHAIEFLQPLCETIKRDMFGDAARPAPG